MVKIELAPSLPEGSIFKNQESASVHIKDNFFFMFFLRFKLYLSSFFVVAEKVTPKLFTGSTKKSTEKRTLSVLVLSGKSFYSSNECWGSKNG